MYVYVRSEPSLWTVGHYDPTGKWHPDSDHGRAEEAAERVAWLNGGRRPTICKGAGEIIEQPLGPGRVEAIPAAPFRIEYRPEIGRQQREAGAPFRPWELTRAGAHVGLYASAEEAAAQIKELTD